MIKLKSIVKEIFDANLLENNVEITIYCDMDGVICDFEKQFETLTNTPPSEFESKNGTKEFWNVIIKEKEELRNNTKVSMITSILDMDNDIALALKNIKDDSAREGVELISNKVTTFLKTQGIEPIQTETYDEDLHEVISIMEIGESKIIDVVSKGYTLNDKPFRYPKIILGK